jgi:hypothetical protein
MFQTAMTENGKDSPMVSRWMLPMLLTAQLLASTAHAGIRWEFDGTGAPTGGDVALLGGKPAFAPTDTGQGLAPGTTLTWADTPELRLCPEIEISARFRLDELPKSAQVLASKDGEYLLRVDGHEDGHLSFFVQIDGKWDPRLKGPVVQAGIWYDVRVVWSGQELMMEVNGETFTSNRAGRTKPGVAPLLTGPVAGVVDRLEIRNPSLERAVLLAVGAAEQVVERTAFGGGDGWQGWKGLGGAGCEVRADTATVVFPSDSAIFASPALACDLTSRQFVCLEIASLGPGRVGYLDFVTDAGVGSLSFVPQSDGRLNVIDGSQSDAWTGTLRRLALRLGSGDEPVAIRRLVLTDRPVGTPWFYLRSLAAGRAKLRPGREETVVLGLQNVGGEAENITVRLAVPDGVELLGEARQTIPYLGMDDFDMATWRIRAVRPGTFTVRVEASGAGAETQGRDLALAFEPLPPEVKPADYVPRPQPAKTDYITLMHYCALWKEGTHYGWKLIEPWPEKRPAIGWYDEGTPEVADWHIKYALEHGINGFIYCWYRANQEPQIEQRLGHAIHDGLFAAKYRDMFTFTIMWENGRNGVNDEADLLDNVLPFWIKNYFTHPSYLKIDNQPVLVVWRPERLLSQLGGPVNTRQAFDKMRAQCREAGFGGLRIIACMPAANPILGKQIAESGWDAVTGYNLSPAGVKIAGHDPAGLAYRDYADVLSRFRQAWLDRDACTGDVPDIPNVVMNRDDRPWGRVKRGQNFYTADPKAEIFEVACREAKELVDAKPADRWDSKIVVLDNWTEFGEGHYIEPTTGTGFTFANAVKRVFCTDWAPEAVTDIIPEDLGMRPPQRWYEATRATFGDRMPWQPVRITGDLLAHWEFDTEAEKDGPFADSSPNGIQLRNEGVATESGRGGGVLRCGGGGATASVPSAFFSPGGVTVALWCQPSEANQNGRWILNTSGATSGYRIGLSGGLPVWQVPRENWSHGLKGSEPLPAGEWSHVAATFDNQVMRLYVNGQEVGVMERRGFIRPGTPITLGAHSINNVPTRFLGWLDDVRVYRRALPPEEIAKLAQGTPK